MHYSPIGFLSTNESLDAITAGLSPNSTDHVLSITGSGDVPFALFEYARLGISVDSYAAQTDYAQRRAQALLSGDISSFLPTPKKEVPMHPSLIEASRSYFFAEGRMDRIRANLHGLTFLTSSIQDITSETLFTKIYLSNALNSNHRADLIETRAFLEKLAGMLVLNGLVYISKPLGPNFHQHTLATFPYQGFSYGDSVSGPPLHSEFIPPVLVLDNSLTSLARSLERPKSWEPVIYRKIT